MRGGGHNLLVIFLAWKSFAVGLRADCHPASERAGPKRLQRLPARASRARFLYAVASRCAVRLDATRNRSRCRRKRARATVALLAVDSWPSGSVQGFGRPVSHVDADAYGGAKIVTAFMSTREAAAFAAFVRVFFAAGAAPCAVDSVLSLAASR